MTNPTTTVELELRTPYMLAEVVDGIGWMTFNNPERRNAMKLEMNEAIVDILGAFQADDSVRVVVMQGAGDKAFVSGADISEFETHRSTPAGREHFDAVAAAAGRAFAELDKPLIAKIRGFCMGGGLATALSADIRITAADGQFAIPAARLGLGYGFAGIKKLVSLVGPAMVNEIMMSARRFSADEAAAMGLVNRVVPGGELDAAVAELAAQIAANAPLTVKAAKAAVQEAVKDPDRRDLARVEELVENCFRSEDYVEGRQAFMEKRTAQFKGR
ncbi:MAG: enoyl-CoA hydratase [Acidimicrobiia bacterium]|nr:enoyl-CoA hydratase [Acidimicrobiia bacterium]